MSANESRKRGMDDVGDDGEVRKRSRGNEPLLKMLIPSIMCGHVLGKGGSYVKELRTTYGGHIAFSEPKQFYPGTEERICLITGTIEQVRDISCQILDRLMEHEDKRTRILVTSLGAGMILGKGGATIKQIQEETGVKMVIGGNLNGMGGNERPVTMTGTLQQRTDTIKLIIAKIAEEPSNMANTKVKYDAERALEEVRPSHGGDSFAPPQYPPFEKQLLRPPIGVVGPIEKQLLRPPMGVVGPIEKQLLRQPMGVIGPMGGPQHNHGKRPRLNVLPSTVELTIDVPRQMVGYIMGKGGQGIKEMSRSTNFAKFIFAPLTEGEEESRRLTVKGTIDQVTAAYDLVHDKVDEYTNYQQLYHPQSQPNF